MAKQLLVISTAMLCVVWVQCKPQKFHEPIQASQQMRDVFMKVVRAFNRLTCIRLEERTTAPDYLLINGHSSSCDSYVGYVGGAQTVNLGEGCLTKGHGIHEIMHALGFFHEQARPDRDEFVRIIWENIQDGAEEQFEKYLSSQGLSGTQLESYPYDIDSIMHYTKTAFSKNGQPTIEDIGDPSAPLGQLEFFSTGDLFKINTIYNCPDRYRHAKEYKITVETSDDWFSGTDSRVFLKLHGSNGHDSGEIELEEGSFEAGDIDIETHLLPDLDSIWKVEVWHSNEGLGASWKLESITIEDKDEGESYEFEYDDWLTGDPSENKKTLT